jgi:hypothetical protein
VIPGTIANELEPLPATPVSSVMQSGGSPWAAFVSTAVKAAPAAVLLGAYAMSRSSGLGDPHKRHRRSSRSIRRTRRRR